MRKIWNVLEKLRIKQGYRIRSFVDRIYAYDTTYDKYDEYDIRYEDLIWKKQQKTHEALVVKHSLQAQ